jgi:hypothetical protein
LDRKGKQVILVLGEIKDNREKLAILAFLEKEVGKEKLAHKDSREKQDIPVLRVSRGYREKLVILVYKEARDKQAHRESREKQVQLDKEVKKEKLVILVILEQGVNKGKQVLRALQVILA